jgi:two-component system cell cycle response regulator
MARHAWHWALAAQFAVLAAVIVLYAAGADDAGTSLAFLLGGVCPVLIAGGVRLHRPEHARPWLMLALSQSFFMVSVLTIYITQVVLGQSWFPGWADLVNLVLVYPTLICAALLFVRVRAPGWHLPTVLDMAVMATAATMLSWIYLITPTFHVGGIDWLGRAVAATYPILDLLLLTLTLRLSLGTGRRVPAYVLFVGFVATYLIADTVYLLQRLHDSFSVLTSPSTVVGYAAAGVLLGTAALHPSMVHMSDLADSTHSEATRGRMLTLAVVSLIAPTVLAAESLRDGFGNGLVIAVACGILFLLVLSRVSGLITAQKALSLTDALTGLYTRRFMEPALRNEVAKAQRTKHPLSLLMVDIDHFKSVNDTYGHAAGDKVLAEVATRMRSACRAYDIASRYGGEEFSVILPNIDTAALHTVAQRIVTTVAASPILLVLGGELTVTVSVGMAVYPVDVQQLEDFIPAADEALYVAKRTGRNRVVAVAPGGWLSQGELIPQAAA